MALDRGKLQHLLFDEGDGLAFVANRVMGTILSLPPAKRALARDQVKSRFVQIVIDRFKRPRKAAA